METCKNHNIWSFNKTRKLQLWQSVLPRWTLVRLLEQVMVLFLLIPCTASAKPTSLIAIEYVSISSITLSASCATFSISVSHSSHGLSCLYECILFLQFETKGFSAKYALSWKCEKNMHWAKYSMHSQSNQHISRSLHNNASFTSSRYLNHNRANNSLNTEKQTISHESMLLCLQIQN